MNEYYRLACEKGWHDNDERVPVGPVAKFLVKYLDKTRRWLCRDGQPSARQNLAWVSLILTEWLEALDEAYESKLWYFDSAGKPCGRLSELADIWIRCMDTLGAHGMADVLGVPLLQIPERIVDRIAYALGTAAEACRTNDQTLYYRALVTGLNESRVLYDKMVAQAWARNRREVPSLPSFDVAVDIKHEYNKTRSYRHGGKLA